MTRPVWQPVLRPQHFGRPRPKSGTTKGAKVHAGNPSTTSFPLRLSRPGYPFRRLRSADASCPPDRPCARLATGLPRPPARCTTLLAPDGVNDVTTSLPTKLLLADWRFLCL